MAAGRQRRAEAETFTARWKKQWHRARVGVRRAAVDYFRGDGSDWIALAGLLLTVPVIAATTMANSVWCSPSALVIPIVAGGLLLRPASLLGLYAAAATALIVESVQLGPYTEGPSRVTPGVVLVVAACGFFGQAIATTYVAVTAREGTSSAVGLYVTSFYVGGAVGAYAGGIAWGSGAWPACVGLVLGMLAVMTLIVATTWTASATGSGDRV